MRLWIAIVFGLRIGIHISFGALSLPSDSYVLVSPDQSRCLVMARSIRARSWSNDAGRIATLPDGRKVDLYAQFPSNGVYRLPDLNPVYFLAWSYESNRLAFTPDFGAIALIEEYALDKASAPSSLSWPKAIRFFNAGREVYAYSTAKLVEIPIGASLAPDDYGRFNRAWLGSFRVVKSDQLEVVTTPRGLFFRGNGLEICDGNRFVFDLHTGALLSDDRPFARLRHRVALGLVATIAAGLALFIFRRSRANPE